MEKLTIKSINPPSIEKEKKIYEELSILIQALYYS